jgi:hypothetical protein
MPYDQSKGEVLCLIKHYPTKTYGGMDVCIFDLSISWRLVVSFTFQLLYPLRKEPLVFTGLEVGWAPEEAWTLWRGEKSLPYWFSNSDPSAVQTVANCYTDCGILALKFKITEK